MNYILYATLSAFFFVADANNARIHPRDISHALNSAHTHTTNKQAHAHEHKHTHTQAHQNDQLLWHLQFRNVNIMQTNFPVPKFY